MEVRRRLGVDLRAIFRRRANLQRKYDIVIDPPKENGGGVGRRSVEQYPHRLEFDVSDGVVLVGGDGHYWPGQIPAAHRAFVKMCKEFKPRLVIMNGDALDGATISRHPPIGWENRPALVAEIEATKERLSEIEAAAFKAHKVWNCGNHDARFATRLATVAPEYAKIHGTQLKDHFPLWEPAWEVWVNDEVVVRHRFKGGIHATHNNTLWAGKTTVTGHLHSLKVTPFSDYNGTRFGVDAGCLADPYGPQFINYTEGMPVNWRSGFAVLTFRKGRLMWPEVVARVDNNTVEWRGDFFAV